jgi:uncharacterized protein YPO0396
MSEGEMIAIAFSGVTLLVLVGEKLFGGGNALAAKFAALDKETTASMARLERELTGRVDAYEDNYGVGIEAIKANIHAMQLALLEFRAKMAEDYMHKNDYAAGINEVRSQLRDSFKKVEDRLGRIEESMHGQHSNGPR